MHENGAQHGSQLFAKLGFKELVGIRSDKETSCTTAWSFFCGGNMSKKIMPLITILCIVLGMVVPVSAAPSEFMTKVNYYVYRNGQVICIKEVAAEYISDIHIPLFQAKDDANGFRSDGYTFSCETTIDLDGVSVNNSVKIEFSNPVTYNVESQTLNGARNRLYVCLIHTDGTKQDFYFGEQGVPNDVGNAPILQIGEYGVVEYSDEMCLTLLKGVSIDRVHIAIELYADLDNPTPIPMSWWDNGSISFGEMTYMDELVTDIKGDTDRIVEQMTAIVNQSPSDKVQVDNMQSDVSNKVDKSEQILEDSKVDKPSISDDELDPMDKVDDGALDSMGGMIGAVFVSPTLGSIAFLTLTFALLGFILYGKR